MTLWLIGGCIVAVLVMGAVILLVVAGGSRLGKDERDERDDGGR